MRAYGEGDGADTRTDFETPFDTFEEGIVSEFGSREQRFRPL